MNLYGKHWTRRQLEARVGRIEQIGGVRRYRLAEGLEDGTEQIEVRTGAGLHFRVTPSKGMDLSLAEFGGTPFSWQSPNGDVHPSYYNDRGTQWLRTASGGLLMTCGLIHAGSPDIADGEELGLHGRCHHLPARQVTARGKWRGDEYEYEISGTIEETSIFGDQLILHRTIAGKLGENRISLYDRVENTGYKPSPHMMLYHFNFGFPLMDEQTVIRFPPGTIQARDAEMNTEGYERWQAPDPLYREQVYYHRPTQEKPTVTLQQPAFPVGAGTIPLTVTLAWEAKQLPNVIQWKMPGFGTHVLGVEPSNCFVEGRNAERKRGSLVQLEPGEAAEYRLELNIIV
ncbi:MAG: hypothetical protein K0Q59_3819 [Paenibacillus sp.]|jgi:hypothetical protein|nr:hypothetical protein [Paenibacillus sp.]